VLSRTFDPHTQQLITTRLLLKRSRLPSAILKLLPRSLLGVNGSGENSQSYILERSVVDVREGWMRTESRNLDLRSVLDVVERQTYLRPTLLLDSQQSPAYTTVTTTVTLHSRLGQRLLNRPTDAQPKQNFLVSWSQSHLQRSIEAIGLNRASKSQPNAMEGMKVVLERLREGGLVKVLEGMRRDAAGTGAGADVL